MTPREAETLVADARIKAEGIKQAAIAEAMKLPMPQHLAAVRKAERDFHLAIADACDETHLIDGTPFRNAAARA